MEIIESLGGFFIGWWQSARDPLPFIIYLTIFFLGVKTIISNSIIHGHLNRIDKGVIEIDILEVYDDTEVQLFVERYFSKYSISRRGRTLLSKMEYNKMIVSLLIIIGVLGTFFSLVLSFEDIDKAFSTNIANQDVSAIGTESITNEIADNNFNGIGNILKKMSIAFYTSIAGMIFSILLSIISKRWNNELLLNKIMLKYEVSIEKVSKDKSDVKREEEAERKFLLQMETNQSIAETRDAILEIGQALKTFSDFSSEIGSTAKNLKNLNKDLDQSVGKYDVMFKAIESTIENYEKGLEDMNSNFKNLFTYFNQIDSEKKFFVDFVQNQNETSVQQFNLLHNMKKAIDITLLGADVANNKLINQNSELISKIETIHDENLRNINDLYQKINDQSIRMQNEIILESKKMYQQNIDQVEMYNNNVFDKNYELISEINTLQASLNAKSTQLDLIRQQITENINNGFISNLNEFDNKIDIFNNRLEKVVDRIDNGLEINIEKALRNFSEYVKFTQDILTEKLNAITKVVSIYEKSGEHHLEELFLSVSEFNTNLLEIAYLLKENANKEKSIHTLNVLNGQGYKDDAK